jgi:hypothetical protein
MVAFQLLTILLLDERFVGPASWPFTYQSKYWNFHNQAFIFSYNDIEESRDPFFKDNMLYDALILVRYRMAI